MCGILGVCSSNIRRSLIEDMSLTLIHRGPDSSGVWASQQCDVILGHRRLAIIDLSENGAQPMVFSGDGLAIAYNGEVYNFQEIKDDLRASGIRFQSNTDTEVLLRAYQKWGKAAIQRFSGMFSIAIVDENQKRLVLARDPCGQKPLYYIYEPGLLAFASEIKALHVFRPGMSKIDSNGLEDYLAYGYSLGPHTLTVGVSKVLPGQTLVYDMQSGTLVEDLLWEVPHRDKSLLTSGRAEQQLEVLLQDSVERHLVSDVPVGLLLSGGIDSSLITAMAARSGRALRTFSVVFPGQKQRDESEYARAVSKHFGTKHLELEMEEMSADVLHALAYQFDDPIADHAIVPTYLLSKIIRKYVTVALSGDGGDELFGGYPHYGLMRHQTSLRYIPKPLRSLLAAGAERLEPGVRGRNHLIGLKGPLENSIAHINMLFDASQRKILLGYSDGNSPENRKSALISSRRGSAVDKAMYSDFRTTMAEAYLTKVDRAAMANSLEIRAPLLDDSIVNFAWRDVGTDLKYAAGRDKILLRRLAARLLPTKIADKPKQGLTMPLNSWLQDGSNTFLKDVLLDSSQALFDRSAVLSLFDQQRRGRNNASRLFALTMLTLWADKYGMSRG